MLPERRIFGRRFIRPLFDRPSFRTDATPLLDLDLRSPLPPSRIDIGDRIYGGGGKPSPLSHASPFFKPGNRWQATQPGFSSILSVQAKRNIANAIQKQSLCLRNEVGIGDYRLGLRTATT